MRGYRSRLEARHDENAWLAWHIAVLSRAAKIPDLSKLTSRPPQARRMSVEEIEFNLRQLVLATAE